MRVRGEIWTLILLLATGALLRGLYLSELVASPGALTPQIDAGYHDYWARGLAFQTWNLPPQTHDPQIQTTPFFRPPGYPYFLSVVYRLTGGDAVAVRMVQMALGLLSAFLAFVIGRRWFGGRMGLLFCGFVATYWGLIYFEGDLLDPPLMVALLLLLVWSLGLWTDKFTWLRALGSGALLGGSALVRPTVLLAIPAILGWAYWMLRDRRQFSIAAAGLLLATALTIAPATIRNDRVAKDFVLISSNSGINLLLGNHAEANGTITPTVPGLGELGTSFDYPKLVSAIETKLGRSLKHSEVSAHLGAMARAYIWAHPLETLKLTFKKALLFWGPREVGNNKEDELERASSRVLQWIPGNFASSMALFILGMVAFLRRWKTQDRQRGQLGVLITLLIAVNFIAYLPYFVAGRFRMPLVPLLLFFAAFFLDQFIGWIQARRWQVVAVWLVGGMASYALASQNFTRYEPLKDKWHFDRGVRLAQSGQIDAAMGEYAAALAIRPTHFHAEFNLGALLEFKGRIREAETHYKKVLSVNPEFALAHHALGKILARQGDIEWAARHFNAALTLDPSPSLYMDYADLLVKQGKNDLAMAAYQNAVRLNPKLAPAHNNLAVLLFLKGDYAGAWRAVELCRRFGGSPSEEFVQTVRQKLAQ
jgi:tetratricopeptide (TPR) repeat protein